MKILIVSIFFPPGEETAANRPYSWAKYFSDHGHEVDVLTIQRDEKLDGENFKQVLIPPPKVFSIIKSTFSKKSPSFSHSKGPEKRLWPLFKQNIRNYLQSRGVGSSVRMPDPYSLYVNKGISLLLEEKKNWDICISTAGPPASHSIGFKIKKLGLTNFWIMDFRDQWSNHPFFKGLPIISAFERWLEKRFLLSADLITAVSQNMGEKINQYSSADKLLIIENGFNADLLDDFEKIEVKERKVFRITYAGTLYLQHTSPELIFECINELKEDNQNVDHIEINFIGPIKKELKELVDRYQVGDIVKITGLIPRRSVFEAFKNSDALLFLDYCKTKRDGILTSKIYELLFMKKPIWSFTGHPQSQTAKILENSGCGFIFGNNKEKIKEALIHPKEFTNIVPNLSFIQSFSRKNISERFLKEIKKLVYK